MSGTFQGKVSMKKNRKGVMKKTITFPAGYLSQPAKSAVTKIVKSQIARQSENKQIGWQVESNTQHNSGISSADCLPIVQEIRQGVSAQNRVGDRVKPKSLKLRGVLSFNPDDCNSLQNMYARVLILSQKNIKTGQAVVAGGVDAARLLKPSLDGAAETAYAGATMDINTPVNTELFRVYMDKTIKLTCANVALGGREAMPMYSARWSKTFKQLPASFTYDQGNGDWANNFAPFLAIGYAYSDGTAPDTITTKLISNVLSVLDYEDA